MSINFSFIIPHRNSPDLLMRCVDSIPSRNDIEVIVVDDNSEPSKRPVIQRKDVKVVYIEKEDSKWAGHARNKGMEVATGKWILFADCDDYYCDDLIGFLDRYLDSTSDVVYFNYNTCSRGNCTASALYNSDKNCDIIKYRENSPWNKMTRRSFLINYGICFEECINGNDMFYSYQVGFFARKIEVEKTPIYCYQVTHNSMTNKKKNSDEYYLCRLKHWYQTREFFNFVNHPEWKSPICMRFIAVLYRKGFSQFLRCCMVYFRNYQSIKRNKYKFVESMR